MENPEGQPAGSKILEDTRRELSQALSECARLRDENARLRRLISEHDITIPIEPDNGVSAHTIEPVDGHPTISNQSNPDVKIALFRSLFRSREDVYAVRW